jgi:hypothetical protein
VAVMMLLLLVIATIHKVQPATTPTLPKDDDVKWLALLIRRGLLCIIKGIEARYDLGERDKAA